jgi:hypothetical protein
MNEKLCQTVADEAEEVKRQLAVLADAQYNSSKVREDVRLLGAEPIIPYRRSSKVKNGLKVGKDFITRGVKRLVQLFRKRVSVERMFGRTKEWLLLDHLRVRGVEQAFIHACLSFLGHSHYSLNSCQPA